LLSNLIVV
jgi:translocation protein SEC62